MTFHRLDPSIPVDTPKGPGRAIAIVDYSEDHHALWVVALDASGEVWWVRNPDIRIRANWSLGTTASPIDETAWAAANKGKYSSIGRATSDLYIVLFEQGEFADIWQIAGEVAGLIHHRVPVRKS